MSTGASRTRALRAYVLAGAAWMLAHALGVLGPLDDATFVVIGISSLGASLYGLRINDVDRPRPWLLLVGATIIWLVGGGLRLQMETLGDLTADRAVLPDLFSMAGYVLAGSGLIVLHNRRFSDRGRDFDALLDAFIAAIAAAAVVWIGIFVPALQTDTPSPRVEILLVVYPVLTVALAMLVLRFTFSSTTAEVPSHRYLVGAFCCVLIGDAVYMVLELDLVTIPLAVADLPYGLGYLCFGAAMLHPSVVDADRPVESSEVRANRFRVLAVGVALCIPAVITLLGGSLAFSDRVVLAALGTMLAVAAVWRMTRAVAAQNAVQHRLTVAATHDPLTSLPNRTYLAEHLAAMRDDHRLVGALFADLDRFKLINDGLGHGTGDTLLRAVAARLRENAGPDDFVARVGGDEFVVVTRADEHTEIEDLAERLRCSLGVPFRIGSSEIHASMSVGIRVVEPGSKPQLQNILEDADSALYQAKRRGRNTVVVFDHSMREWADNQLLIEQELNNALELGQLDVAFQPVVRLPDGVLEGFEALVRWEHPVMGAVEPAVFVPVAEETGLIVPIGAWVLDEACAQLRRWRNDGTVGQVTMAVNVSPRQLMDRRFVETVAATVERHDVAAGALHLEITEGVLTSDPVAARRVLDFLRLEGVRISLDDFGTGYSSIAQLKSFPVDTVKIDRSFVQGIGYTEPSSDESLVAAIVAMSQALGFGTVAEGVETSDQASRLFELGVRAAQGFHFGRPVLADQMAGVLQALREQHELRWTDS